MENSKNFGKVKDYYEKGLWNKDRVYAVVNKWITPEEYEIIVKEKYIVKTNE